MEKPSVFEKRHGEDDVVNKVGGVLDQFNLPPALVEYVRKNLKTIQIAICTVVVLTVFFSLYGSYREKKVEEGITALALAINGKDDDKIGALTKIVEEYSNTPAGIWAKIEIAHSHMGKKDYDKAASIYEEVQKDVGKKNPLYPLSVYGLAQAQEILNNLDGAYASYEIIKDIEGYKGLGYKGIARIHESKKEFDKALEVYQQYLVDLAEFPSNYPEKMIVEEKVASIRSIK